MMFIKKRGRVYIVGKSYTDDFGNTVKILKDSINTSELWVEQDGKQMSKLALNVKGERR